MGQPTFVRKIDGSSAAASSLVLTMTTTIGDMLLVGVVLSANGSQAPQTVAAITDSAGLVSGVAVNTWTPLGNSTQSGIRMEWWVCKGAASITNLTVNLTGTQSIVAVALEYSAANGIANPIFQALIANQNTIVSQHIHETASTFPNSGAELMIGLFSMLSDTFNATPLAGTNRSTNSLSIPPSLSYQVLEQGTADANGQLGINAVSATQLATPTNVSASSMQCLYILISGGLILNAQPGFSDQPDTALAAGNNALGLQLAKINGNAAFGMVRMEFFQGIYNHGQTVALPVSPVDGYQYQRDELTYVWALYSSADTGDGWITGPAALWYCFWNVNQTTGEVTSTEVYRSDGASAVSNDGWLQVFTIAQRQKVALTVSAAPTWTQQQPSDYIADLAYAQDRLVALNNNAKFAVVAQECISMGEFYNGQTVPAPVSPADAYAYAYSEVKFVFSWRWTTGQTAYVQLDCPPYYNLASLHAVVGSTGAVTCAVGMMGQGGESYGEVSTFGRIAVFALCQRARSGTPAAVANGFAEINNSLFYPGNPLPATAGAQLAKNIQEAALSPEFFGPTLYAPGDTIPTPTSPIDGYVYSRAELTYVWEWSQMIPGNYPGSSGDHDRCALFSADINQSTGAVTDVLWRLAPGGPYVQSTTYGKISVVVCGFRSSQASAFSTPVVTAPSGAGSASADETAQGAITVNGV
jgi:hypothetical protein